MVIPFGASRKCRSLSDFCDEEEVNKQEDVNKEEE